jgi:hypothetical protein
MQGLPFQRRLDARKERRIEVASGNLDKILACSCKNALRLFRYFESSKWGRVNALVTGHIVNDPIWWGCPTVKLHYKFYAEGRSIKGWDVIPFVFLPDARAYAESFTHNLPKIIRVNPKNPQETHFFERDQKG